MAHDSRQRLNRYLFLPSHVAGRPHPPPSVLQNFSPAAHKSRLHRLILRACWSSLMLRLPPTRALHSPVMLAYRLILAILLVLSVQSLPLRLIRR